MQQDADLDGPPANEEQGHHHLHHAGDPHPHGRGSLCLNLELEEKVDPVTNTKGSETQSVLAKEGKRL